MEKGVNNFSSLEAWHQRDFETLGMVGSYPMPTPINLHIHLIIVINEYEASNVWSENTLWGGHLRQFNDMCIKNTFAKCVSFNFGFHCWCLGFIFWFSES